MATTETTTRTLVTPVNLKRFYTIVESTLKEMGMDLKEAKVPDTEGQWVYIKGSAFTMIEIGCSTMHDDEQIHYIQAFSPICLLPTANREAFFLELLKYNHNLLGTFFCIHNDLAILKLIRDLKGLNKIEVRTLIEDVAYVSDKLDNKIIRNFGVEKADVNFTMLYDLAKVQLLSL